MEGTGTRAPLGHAAIVEGLWSAARETRLAHALGFDGQEGVGKFHAARWFAAGLLCKDGPGAPCGSCPPCKRVASGNHADLCIIDPEALGEESIRVDFIRRKPDSDCPVDPPVEEFLELKAHEGGFQVVILRDACTSRKLHRDSHVSHVRLINLIHEVARSDFAARSK